MAGLEIDNAKVENKPIFDFHVKVKNIPISILVLKNKDYDDNYNWYRYFLNYTVHSYKLNVVYLGKMTE